jgi:hypothetical protein
LWLVDRFVLDANGGLDKNYLCVGLKKYFAHVVPPMLVMVTPQPCTSQKALGLGGLVKRSALRAEFIVLKFCKRLLIVSAIIIWGVTKF